MYSNLNYTLERERNRKISFLDIEIHRKNNKYFLWHTYGNRPHPQIVFIIIHNTHTPTNGQIAPQISYLFILHALDVGVRSLPFTNGW